MSRDTLDLKLNVKWILSNIHIIGGGGGGVQHNSMQHYYIFLLEIH